MTAHEETNESKDTQKDDWHASRIICLHPVPSQPVRGGRNNGEQQGGSTDAYVRKFSFAGTVLWTREFGTQGFDIETALTMGRDGLYVAGRTSGAFPGYSNAGSYYAFVRKYDPTGNVLWTTQLETLGLDIIFSDAMTQRNGALYIAGSADGTFPGPPGQGVDIYCKACSCRFPSERMKNFSEWRTHENRELPA